MSGFSIIYHIIQGHMDLKKKKHWIISISSEPAEDGQTDSYTSKHRLNPVCSELLNGGVWRSERVDFTQHIGFMETLKKAALSMSHFQVGTSGLFLAIYGHSYFWFLPEHGIKRATKGCYADILNPAKHFVYPWGIQCQWSLEQFWLVFISTAWWRHSGKHSLCYFSSFSIILHRS